MKPLLKLLTYSQDKDLNKRIMPWKQNFLAILDHAEQQNMVVWAKDLEFNRFQGNFDKKTTLTVRLAGGFKKYINNDLTITHGDWSDYLDIRTIDKIIFEYPGDKVKGESLRSKVSKTTGVFTLIDAFFDEGVLPDLPDKFKEQKGSIATDKANCRCLHVTTDGPPIQMAEPGQHPFFTVNQDIFRCLFPKKQPSEHSAPAGALNKIKKLLRSKEPDQIVSGLSLLEALNDPELFESLLRGTTSTTTQLIPNKIFKGERDESPLRNTALTGVLKLASHLPAWQAVAGRIEELELPVMNADHMSVFTNLKKLSMWEVKEINAPLEMPFLRELSIEGSTYQKIPFQFTILSNCIELNTLKMSGNFIINELTELN